MRTLNKPSTAACTLEHYTAFLLAEPKHGGCVRLAEVSGEAFTHDAVNRFLRRECFEPRDLFEQVRSQISLEGGTLKRGRHGAGQALQPGGQNGLGGLLLERQTWPRGQGHQPGHPPLQRRARGVRVPVNWRAVDKAEKKTKNELFREMLEEVLAWGLRPAWVSADAWYSSLENLKFLRKHELGFLVGLEKNRTLSEREHEYRRVEEVAVPERGRVLHLRGFGFVSVFRTIDKNNDVRHYAAFEPAPKKSLVKSSPSAASSGCTPSTGAWNATTALLNKSAMPSTSSCAGSEPSLTTSSARCAPSSISNKPSGVENS
jgi:hypothetical protein